MGQSKVRTGLEQGLARDTQPWAILVFQILCLCFFFLGTTIFELVLLD